MAVGLSAFSLAPDPACPVSADLVGRGPSITIHVQASINAGDTLCFNVVCYGGIPAVTVEINEIILPVTVTATADGSVTVCCVRIPTGCAGSTALITAVGPSGEVATASVSIT